MPKIVVTGGAGYIGSITARHLAARGDEVVVIDDLSRGHREAVPSGTLHAVRLQDTGHIAELLRGAQAVIHFAGYIAVGESVRQPEMYFSNNVGGTLCLFEAMSRAGVSTLVFSSTAAVYGNPERVPIPEDSAIAPVSPYGESKAMIEKILRQLDLYRGVRSISLRYFNACGAEPEHGLGELHEPETHLIPLLLRAVSSGRPMQVFGNDYPTPDGTCIRDYIHVSDLARAHLVTLDALLAGAATDALNVGTGSGHTVLEVMQMVEQVTGMPVPHRIVGRREGDAASLVADSGRLRRTLGWEPKRSGLREIVEDAWTFFRSR
jgi:UDP-glucose-4-epimerase GalE